MVSKPTSCTIGGPLLYVEMLDHGQNPDSQPQQTFCGRKRLPQKFSANPETAVICLEFEPTLSEIPGKLH